MDTTTVPYAPQPSSGPDVSLEDFLAKFCEVLGKNMATRFRGHLNPPSILSQFLSDECWTTTHKPHIGGYVRVHTKRLGDVALHRASLLIYGFSLEGMQVDHKCHTRTCFRPSHLEALTPSEHARKTYAVSPISQKTLRLVCSCGAMRVANKNKLDCPACKRNYNQRYRQKNRSALNLNKRQWYAANRADICARRNAAYLAKHGPPAPRLLCGARKHSWVPENIYTYPNGKRVCRLCKVAHERRHREAAGAAPSRRDQTTCRRGHPRVPANTYISPQGATQCRACRMEYGVQYRAAKRAQATPNTEALTRGA